MERRRRDEGELESEREREGRETEVLKNWDEVDGKSITSI